MVARKKLKLFVWEGVLADYSSGIAFALAYSVDEARMLVLKKLGYDSNTPKRLLTEFDSEPLICETPEAFYKYGGG